jgi:hypothetical protein
VSAVAALLVAAVSSVSSGVVGSVRRRVDVDVAWMAVMMVSDPAVVNAPMGRVEALPAPPIPIIVGATPVVVAVVARPTSVGMSRSIVVRCPPVDMRPFKDTPMARHVVNGVGVVIPIPIPLATVECGVAYEVIDSVFFVYRVLVEIHPVFVGVQAVASTPAIVFVGGRMLPPVLVECDCLVGCSRGGKHEARAKSDCQYEEGDCLR